jgi:hypothetical protein
MAQTLPTLNLIGAGRVGRISALHCVISARKIIDGAGERPEMVEARDKGKAAGARQPAEGGLQPEHATE